MKDLVRLFYECGQMKKIPRSGWLRIGIDRPESLADHSFRTAFIGYFLAKMEKANPKRVLELCVFHDFHEARIGDPEWVSCRYLKEDRDSALIDLLKGIFCASEVHSLMAELFEEKTLEARVAKDADRLDMITQAREYFDSGNKYALEWIPPAKAQLYTESAKKLADEIESTSSNKYWRDMPPPKKEKKIRSQ